MKKLLPNLLVLFSLGLCVLISIQWVRESQTRREMVRMNQSIYEKGKTILDLQSGLKHADTENGQLSQRNAELKETIKTNDQEIVSLKKSAVKSENEIKQAAAQIEEYKKAVHAQNDAIKKQNENIKEQNELMKKLGDDRNEVAQKLNETVKQYNDVVQKYNDLVKQVEAQQQAAAEAGKDKKK